MLVITRKPPNGTNHVQTGLDIGEHSLQVKSVNVDHITITVNGVDVIMWIDDVVEFAGGTITLIALSKGTVRFGFEYPEEIEISRWNRKAKV